MFVDTHCHLNQMDLTELPHIREARVSTLITIGYDLESSQEAVKIAEANEGVYAAVGFQPTELDHFKEGDLDRIKALTKSNKVVAIGEIGMDYHYEDTDKPLQRAKFIEQILLAEELKLPICIHSRDDAEDMLNLLKDMKSHLTFGGVMHCYSHSKEMVKDFVDLGFYLAFGGTVTYKNARKVVESATAVPLDRLLTETDSPYLPPVPHRGEMNSPKYIPIIAEKLASLREMEVERLAEVIKKNTFDLFKV